MPKLKHLPTKSITISDKLGRIYVRKQHYKNNTDTPKIIKYRRELESKIDEAVHNINKKLPVQEFLKYATYIKKLDNSKRISDNEELFLVLEHMAGIRYLDHAPDTYKFEFSYPVIQVSSDTFEATRNINIGGNMVHLDNFSFTKKSDKLKDASEKMLLTQTLFMDKYFGKDKYTINTYAMTDNIFKPILIGAGIWYYKGMDIVKDDFSNNLITLLRFINNMKKSLYFDFAKTDNEIDSLMLGKFVYDSDKITPEFRDSIFKLFFEILMIPKEYSLELVNELLKNKQLPMRKFLKYYNSTYIASISSTDKLVQNYIRRLQR